MSRGSTTFHINSEQATCAFAQALGTRLQPGDSVLLEGGIGAGKTFFARQLIQSLLTEPEDIPSPTFTLVQVYDSMSGEIWHCDLYRLSDPAQSIELGLEEAFETAICLIEWPDRLGSLTPENALTIRFSESALEDAREVSLNWHDAKWQSRLEGIAG
ncbi:tRNA (adenosine(37)-N6)-threonylcarbamoyltransferase complex ATPase subunit type 1 TsaE [Primorskyibacter marinus]|uniref:tRNA (adenosine(37)-N6)-threonylcarbamoyltransferase complex ATPase subunit type 1 TsaE n=1 Tax=Primorskyibacter marinus TaxID=1977320 RepID=UPI000E306210|nr:tRNA (adenosine(37)-N6)-threonylcarbamoyltransferase complex ATPase subunit type 1 TsaE [Primorskyibacter marinus]